MLKKYTVTSQIYERMTSSLLDLNEEVSLVGITDNRTGLEVPRATVSALVSKINQSVLPDKKFYTRRNADGDLVLGVYK